MDDVFRQGIGRSIRENSNDASPEDVQIFASRFYYISGDYKNASFYADIKSKIAELDKKHKVDGLHIFYLSVPPFLYPFRWFSCATLQASVAPLVDFIWL